VYVVFFLRYEPDARWRIFRNCDRRECMKLNSIFALK
jgi:hypothetical protein